MPVNVLQINFKFGVPTADLRDAFAPLVEEIAAVPGLRWKVWLMNEQEQEAGGVYLFEDEASVKNYLDGPIVAGLMKHPALSKISAKRFDVIDDFTATTRGPV